MSLDLETLHLPPSIKNELKALSSSTTWLRQSGKGSNGFLFFGVEKVLERKIAAKFYYSGGVSNIHKEPKALQSIKSSNIIEIYSAKTVDKEYSLFITPHYQSGDLEDYIRNTKHSLRDAVSKAQSLLQGICDLHAAKYIHRDLKPENIFMTDTGSVVIGDFGSVAKIQDIEDETEGSAHSLIYRPPESCISNKYGRKGDLYQMGLVLYKLLGGSLPYDEQAWLTKKQKIEYSGLSYPENALYAQRIIKNRIVKGKVVDLSTIFPWVHKELVSIVKKATHINPESRYSNVTEFLAAIARANSCLRDWKITSEGYFVTHQGLDILVYLHKGLYRVRKKRNQKWMNDNKILGSFDRSLFEKITKTYLNV